VQKKQPLKTFFILLILWLITIIAVFAGSVLYDRHTASQYEALATPYLKRIIPEISKWDPITTKGLMAPEVSSTIPDENFAQAMTLFSQLGAFLSMDEAKFDELHEDQETKMGTQTIVEYNIDAKYENGDAVINLKLLLRDNSLEIYRFNFSSEILTE
jgi:hypothetical protein